VNGTFNSLSFQIKELCDKSATSGGLIGNMAASTGHLSSGSTDITSAVSSHSIGAAIKSLWSSVAAKDPGDDFTEVVRKKRRNVVSVPE